MSTNPQSIQKPTEPGSQGSYVSCDSDPEDIEYLRAVSDHEALLETHELGLHLQSLKTPISPPLSPINPRKRKAATDDVPLIKLPPPTAPSEPVDPIDEPDPTLALTKYLSSLRTHSLPLPLYPPTPTTPISPRIPFPAFTALFHTNQHPAGNTYVIQQHDHPRAGLHYDLRLQFSPTSTVSWAVPKGLPCNARSRNKRRLAVETRVHPYWYSVVEGGSLWSGTTVVWDCGRYEVLERKVGGKGSRGRRRREREETPGRSGSDSEEEGLSRKRKKKGGEEMSEPGKLYRAFQRGSITLALKGTRFKSSFYSLRLSQTQENPPYIITPAQDPQAAKSQGLTAFKSEDESKLITPPDVKPPDVKGPLPSETQSYRLTNAYAGSSNTIGSIPQRTWFLTRKEESEDSFVVWGKEYERSVVTGRRAMDVQRDLEEKDGVAGMKVYQGRRSWEGIYD